MPCLFWYFPGVFSGVFSGVFLPKTTGESRVQCCAIQGSDRIQSGLKIYGFAVIASLHYSFTD
jgi:hypothetical protein